MGIFSGKRGIVMGVANERSIAAYVSKLLHQEGAELGFSHLPDKDDRKKMERRVRQVADPLNPKFVLPCDVSNDNDIEQFFIRAKEVFPTIDFLLHSIAFAPIEDIKCNVVDASRNGFHVAMDISVYSLIKISKYAKDLMPQGGSICTMTYYGGEKVVAGYNLMGICKAALDASVKYLAYDLGPQQIRVNGVSAGPIKTLAASAVGDFDQLGKLYSAMSPMGKVATAEDVAQGTAFLLGPQSQAISGEIMHIDCGYNVMGSPGHAFERLGIHE